jgi:hypothetical protein
MAAARSVGQRFGDAEDVIRSHIYVQLDGKCQWTAHVAGRELETASSGVEDDAAACYRAIDAMLPTWFPDIVEDDIVEHATVLRGRFGDRATDFIPSPFE